MKEQSFVFHILNRKQYPWNYYILITSIDSYVADEIITSAAGVRVRVGNTDAEGRMAMTDPLFYSKEQVSKNSKLYQRLFPYYSLR